MSSNYSLHDLPDELWLCVFRFLKASDLLTCAVVNHRWRWLASDNTLWCSLILQRGYPCNPSHTRSLKKSFQWQWASVRQWRFDGHSDNVWSIIYDEDRQRIFSGSSDATIKVWNAEKRELIDSWSMADEVLALKAASSNFLWAGLVSGHVSLLDAEIGQQISTIPAHSRGTCSLQPIGVNMLVTGSSDRSVRLWDPRVDNTSGRSLFSWMHEGSVLALHELGPNKIVSGSRDTTVRFYDIRINRILKAEGFGTAVRSITAFGPNEIVCGGGHFRRTSLLTWDTTTLRNSGRLDTLSLHGSAVSCLATSADGYHVVSGSWGPGPNLTLWDVQNRKKMRTLITESDVPFTSLAIGKHAIVASTFSSVFLLDFHGEPWSTAMEGVVHQDQTENLTELDDLHRIPRPSRWGFA